MEPNSDENIPRIMFLSKGEENSEDKKDLSQTPLF